MSSRPRVKPAPFVEVKRRGRQEHVNGRHDVVRLGRHRMGAAFSVELQITSGRSVDSLQAGLNLARRTGGKL